MQELQILENAQKWTPYEHHRYEFPLHQAIGALELWASHHYLWAYFCPDETAGA